MQAEDAARAYDRVAIAMGRPLTQLNFHHSKYSKDIPQLMKLGKDRVIAMCRQSSHGFAKNSQAAYHGITATRSGKWQAQIRYRIVYQCLII